MKQLYKVLIVFTVVCTLTMVLSAHTLVESDENEAVAYLEAQNIIYGDGHSFSGDAPIEVAQAAAMLCRSEGFACQGRWNAAQKSYLRYAVDRGWIAKEKMDYPDSTVSGAELCDMLSNYLASRIGCGQDVNCLAKQLGAIEPYLHSKDIITRYEFAESLYTALFIEASGISLSGGSITPVFYNDLESREYVDEWLAEVPYQIRKQFIADGWTLYVGDGFLKDLNRSAYEEAIGLTMEHGKFVIVTRSGQYSSITHEFGHFLHITNGHDPVFVEIYNREQAHSGFSKHYRSNWREYYAQSFSYYINGMKASFANCPETYTYFDDLRKAGWIVEKKGEV